MFEMMNRAALAAPPASSTPRQARQAGDSLVAHCLHQAFDEIDYGILLVSSDGHVLYLNHAARLELDDEHPLQLLGTSLRAGRAQDMAPLSDALAAAQRGLRRLVMLGEGEHRAGLSVVPLAAEPDGTRATLLLLGKRRVCEPLSVQGFARIFGLTPAETRVLEHMSTGTRPARIAKEQRVAISTVRTQISSIRSKTGADSIRALLRQIAVLPPMVGALRGSTAYAMGAMVMQAVIGH